MSKLHEYAFDCKLFAAIRVDATSRDEAEQILRDKIDSTSCNGGCWDAGQPILFEASLDDGSLELFEVDGEDFDQTIHDICDQ